MTTWLLNLYDAVLTVYATGALGLVESNPLMRRCLDSSPYAFFAIKLLVMTLCCLILGRRAAKNPKSVWVVLLAIATVYAMICGWNTVVVGAALLL